MGGDVTNKPKPSKCKERPPKGSQLAEKFEEATLMTLLRFDPAQQKNFKNLFPKACHPLFYTFFWGIATPINLSLTPKPVFSIFFSSQ